MRLHETIESFLKYIMCERNYSDYTVTNYREDLLQYQGFITEKMGSFDPFHPDLDLVRAWMADMGKRNIKITTIKRRLCALRSYYKYLRRENLLDNNPLSLLTSPKTPKPLPAWVTESQMDCLLDDTDFGNDFEGKRDRLIIDLIYSTGMRRSEVAGLKSSDVDFANKTVRVMGKGKKVRFVPFGEELNTLALDFRNEKMCLFGCDTESFITNEDGEPLSPVKIGTIAHKYLSTIPTLAKQTTHVLRHSFATNMLSNGADLMAVKELLGHASLQSTEVYTHLTPKEILTNYNQAHPRAKKD